MTNTTATTTGPDVGSTSTHDDLRRPYDLDRVQGTLLRFKTLFAFSWAKKFRHNGHNVPFEYILIKETKREM